MEQALDRDPLAMDLEQAELRMEKLLERLAHEKRPCHLCTVEIRLIHFREARTDRMVRMAVNYDGSLHDCRKKGMV